MHAHIIEELFQLGALKVGNFTLKSGQQSPLYVDLRTVISRPTLLRRVSESIWQAHRHPADLLCGIPYAALPMATSVSLDHQVPMIMRRKEAKAYGTKQKIEGLFQPGDSVIIIEDVVTTGMSILETTADLEEAGLKVSEILCFLDRQQGGRQNLEKAGYRFHSAITLTDVAEHLFKIKQIDAAMRDSILAIRTMGDL